MTHIILLDDGKIWAFEPPEKLKSPTIGQSVEYERAYYRALEQKIEVDRSSFTDSCLISQDGQAKSMSFNVDGIRYYLDVNEPIKWDGEVQIIGVGHNGEFKTKYERTVVRLIAQVKEENNIVDNLAKLGWVEPSLDTVNEIPDGPGNNYTPFGEVTGNVCDRCGGPVGNFTFTICDDCWHEMHPPQPVPSEQEKQEHLLIDLLNIWTLFPADEASKRILESFTITRK